MDNKPSQQGTLLLQCVYTAKMALSSPLLNVSKTASSLAVPRQLICRKHMSHSADKCCVVHAGHVIACHDSPPLVSSSRRIAYNQACQRCLKCPAHIHADADASSKAAWHLNRILPSMQLGGHIPWMISSVPCSASLCHAASPCRCNCHDLQSIVTILTRHHQQHWTHYTTGAHSGRTCRRAGRNSCFCRCCTAAL